MYRICSFASFTIKWNNICFVATNQWLLSHLTLFLIYTRLLLTIWTGLNISAAHFAMSCLQEFSDNHYWSWIVIVSLKRSEYLERFQVHLKWQEIECLPLRLQCPIQGINLILLISATLRNYSTQLSQPLQEEGNCRCIACKIYRSSCEWWSTIWPLISSTQRKQNKCQLFIALSYTRLETS